jgi:CheY-like chemotaxis protein
MEKFLPRGIRVALWGVASSFERAILFSVRSQIMVVEDNPGIRQMIVDILSTSGFAVVAFEEPQAALAAARRREPQLIISDIEMPGQSGLDLIRELRADRSLRRVPVIVVSGFSSREHVRTGMGLGADDYITKPFTREELVQPVQARLERRELLDELDSFAHTVAHDLKGPLAVLKGRLELAAMFSAQGDQPRSRRTSSPPPRALSVFRPASTSFCCSPGCAKPAFHPSRST